MSKRKAPLSSPLPEDERLLFRQAVGDVTPLPDHGKALVEKLRPHPVPYQLLRDERQTLVDSLSDYIPWSELENDEDQPFCRAGIARQTLRKMRSGQWVIEAELDLHGLTSIEAREQLLIFLAECKRLALRLVRIIHGKGLGSKNREPVLKQKVRNWLMQREEVLAYCRPRPVDGGGGALLVLLKKP